MFKNKNGKPKKDKTDKSSGFSLRSIIPFGHKNDKPKESDSSSSNHSSSNTSIASSNEMPNVNVNQPSTIQYADDDQSNWSDEGNEGTAIPTSALTLQLADALQKSRLKSSLDSSPVIAEKQDLPSLISNPVIDNNPYVPCPQDNPPDCPVTDNSARTRVKILPNIPLRNSNPVETTPTPIINENTNIQTSSVTTVPKTTVTTEKTTSNTNNGDMESELAAAVARRKQELESAAVNQPATTCTTSMITKELKKEENKPVKRNVQVREATTEPVIITQNIHIPPVRIKEEFTTIKLDETSSVISLDNNHVEMFSPLSFPSIQDKYDGKKGFNIFSCCCADANSEETNEKTHLNRI